MLLSTYNLNIIDNICISKFNIYNISRNLKVKSIKFKTIAKKITGLEILYLTILSLKKPHMVKTEKMNNYYLSNIKKYIYVIVTHLNNGKFWNFL